jgi:hypothetical protein
MSNTITIRLPDDLRDWLEKEAEATGLTMDRLIHDQLEKARAKRHLPAFLHLAGSVEGSPDLSQKRGFEA